MFFVENSIHLYAETQYFILLEYEAHTRGGKKYLCILKMSKNMFVDIYST